MGVTIEINGPPLKGVFNINPNVGVELQTTFLLSAKRFIDPDLPLTYTFGFYPSSNSSDLNSVIGNHFVYFSMSAFIYYIF